MENVIGEQKICFPEYIGQNFELQIIYANCSCGSGVKSYYNYCCRCGAKLNWEELKKKLNFD